jgi:hypothetical protein
MWPALISVFPTKSELSHLEGQLTVFFIFIFIFLFFDTMRLSNKLD